MLQVPEQIQNHLNDPLLMQMNPNLNIMNPGNIPQIIPNQQNIPINPNIQMGLPQQLPNNPQNEDTSKILFLN
jgi:hypothetical protein